MLEKPDVQEDAILDCVGEAFGVRAAGVSFLPLGYDTNTAVYRLDGQDGRAFFLKLRRGDFNVASVAVPQWLKAQGVQAVMAPLETQTGRGWANLGEYRLILYVYVAGANGYEKALSEGQWRAFGSALRGVHTAQLPAGPRGLAAKETFSGQGREQVRQLQQMVEQVCFGEPVARKLAGFMLVKREQISLVVERAEQLAHDVQTKGLEVVLCHGDIHPGNLLIAEDGGLYIVDWDQPLLAPKERDLALIGGCRAWSEPQQAEQFFQGYGESKVDQTALAYFRYERIVQDLAAFGELLLLSEEGGDDREQSFEYFASNFGPGGEIELAGKADPG